MVENNKIAAATGDSVLKVAALLAPRTREALQTAMAAPIVVPQTKALAESRTAASYNPGTVKLMKFAEQDKNRKMRQQGKIEGDKPQLA